MRPRRRGSTALSAGPLAIELAPRGIRVNARSLRGRSRRPMTEVPPRRSRSPCRTAGRHPARPVRRGGGGSPRRVCFPAERPGVPFRDRPGAGGRRRLQPRNSVKRGKGRKMPMDDTDGRADRSTRIMSSRTTGSTTSPNPLKRALDLTDADFERMSPEVRNLLFRPAPAQGSAGYDAFEVVVEVVSNGPLRLRQSRRVSRSCSTCATGSRPRSRPPPLCHAHAVAGAGHLLH